jgi:hypothetical protein
MNAFRINKTAEIWIHIAFFSIHIRAHLLAEFNTRADNLILGEYDV